ncbi:rod-binding protein [Planktotalea arctica]|uniref:rod-binding protein n=1 Tax=Planktotalea arctica TaxID=1481893 RepID=UPI000A16E48F|nr:rod-binding protein [Planktotalea arctica]
MISPSTSGLQVAAPQGPRPDTALSTGQQLEAVFLTEMLKIAGVGKVPETFGGGAGEDQFASFLREAQAKEMVRAGGLGLAAHFDQSIKDAAK